MNDKDVPVTVSRAPRGLLIGWYVAVEEAERPEGQFLPPLTVTNGRKWSHPTSDRAIRLQGCQHPSQAGKGSYSLISRLMRCLWIPV